MTSLIATLERSPLPDPDRITATDVASARADVSTTFAAYGLGVPSWFIRAEGNRKLDLGGENVGAVAGLTLTPATFGPATTCQNFRHCAELCVLTHGRGAFESVRAARAARVAAMLEHPDAVAVLLAHDVDRLSRKYGGTGYALRLNVASDIAYETAAPWLVRRAVAGGALVYDYTKRWTRDPEPVDGYRLTYSAAGHSVPRIVDAVNRGRNVAVVMPVGKGEPVPNMWHGLPVIDGDVSDVRSLDPSGVVVALRAKGKAIHAVGSRLIYPVVA